MRTIWFFIVMMFVFCSGCSVHYYKTDQENVSFYLRMKEASDVHFQYSLDGYRCHEAEKVKDGLWQVVVPSDNEFTYFYMVDGSMYVPPCLFTESDDFGNENCIFAEGM